MEYWVTIAIPNVEEALAEAIFEALIHEDAESGAVMDIELASGRTTFVLGIEADDPLAASSVGVEVFGEALAGAGAHRSDWSRSSTCTRSSHPTTSFRGPSCRRLDAYPPCAGESRQTSRARRSPSAPPSKRDHLPGSGIWVFGAEEAAD